MILAADGRLKVAMTSQRTLIDQTRNGGLHLG